MFLREFKIKNKDNIIALALFGSYNTKQWIEKKLYVDGCSAVELIKRARIHNFFDDTLSEFSLKIVRLRNKRSNFIWITSKRNS